MTDIIRALILGIVEGLTEFIPVSSTGHLIVTGNLLEFTSEFAKTFDVAIQLGAILAVVIIFKNKFLDLLFFRKNNFPNLWQITATSIPALIGGFLLHGIIKQYLFSPVTVAIGLILGSFLMIYADKFAKTKNLEGENPNFSIKNSLIVGLFQTLSLWPGMSRSGSTISGSIFMGMDYKTASAYSFICAVPIMFCATGYELLKASVGGMTHDQFVVLAVGFFTSLILGWLSIVFFIKLISKIKLIPFAIYRIILALIIFFAVFSGYLHASIAMIKTNQELTTFPENVSKLEQIKHYNSNSQLYIIKYEDEKNLISIKDKISMLELNSMYIVIKELAPYMSLKFGERKKVLAEVITNGEKAYNDVSLAVKSPQEMKKFLEKLNISKNSGRLYIELCLDTSEKDHVTLWAYEYDMDSQTIVLIRTPERVKIKES